MKKTLIFVLILSLILSSCMLLNPPTNNRHTVTLRLPGSSGRFVSGQEAQSYTRYYQVRLYPYQNGAITKIPSYTTILPAGSDISFTADTGYYYLELDAWAEKTGTVITGRGSTMSTESFEDSISGISVAGVFDLSPAINEKIIDVAIQAVPDSELPKWNIFWNLSGGAFNAGFSAPSTFNWKTMYPDSTDFEKSTELPGILNVTKPRSAFSGWYLEPDFSGAPITRMSQLPLKDTNLYAKWNDAINVSAEYDGIETKNITLTESRGELTQFITVTASGITSGDTVIWYLNGEEMADYTGNTISYVAEETGVYTFSCIVTNGINSGSASMDVLVTRIENPVFTITLNTNGGFVHELETYQIQVRWLEWNDRSAELLPSGSEVQKEGYSFRGWYVSEDCSGEAVTCIGDLPVRKDATLYAKWHENTNLGVDIEIPAGAGTEFTLFYEPDGGYPGQYYVAIEGMDETDETGITYAWYVDAVLQSSSVSHNMTFTATPGVHTVVCIMTKDGLESTATITITYIPD